MKKWCALRPLDIDFLSLNRGNQVFLSFIYPLIFFENISRSHVFSILLFEDGLHFLITSSYVFNVLGKASFVKCQVSGGISSTRIHIYLILFSMKFMHLRVLSKDLIKFLMFANLYLLFIRERIGHVLFLVAVSDDRLKY